MFSHEKLRVYQAAKQFLGWRVELLKPVKRKVAAVDHLVRASESIGVNISHASGVWGTRERMKYIGYANGSTLECAAAVDILVVKGFVEGETSWEGKETLSRIVGMLVTWYNSTDNQVKEQRAEYHVSIKRPLFKHEQLTVYQEALKLCGWISKIEESSNCSGDLVRKLDKSTTSIVLNIAEGNGRFQVQEQISFIEIAIKAASQASALVDMTSFPDTASRDGSKSAQANLASVMRMLSGMRSKLSARNVDDFGY